MENIWYTNTCRKCGKAFYTLLPFNVLCNKCLKKKEKLQYKIDKLYRKLKKYEYLENAMYSYDYMSGEVNDSERN